MPRGPAAGNVNDFGAIEPCTRFCTPRPGSTPGTAWPDATLRVSMQGPPASVQTDAASSALATSGTPGDWDALLSWLTVPRENGTVALQETADRLVAWLASAGLEPATIVFTAHPHALRLGGLVALLGCLLYARCMRSARFAAALLVALATPLVLYVDLDVGRPIFSALHAERQVHVSTSIAPSGEATQTLIFAAHYDTKTDWLDHAERAWVEAAAVPVTLWMIAAPLLAQRRFRRLERARVFGVAAAPFAAAGLGVLLFATLTAGAFLPARSPGALDDGAACAAALRLAERIAASPLEHTTLEVLLLSAEEVGTQGARELARQRYREPPARPTALVNLEMLGAAAQLAYLADERFAARRHPASPRLVALADESHRALSAVPLERARGGVTDAREFLAREVPAVTLVSHLAGGASGRGLHSAADDRSRIDTAALDRQLEVLEDLARRIDRAGL